VLRSLYNWVVSLAEDPRAIYWLALISFAESSFFPIPPDTLLIPMSAIQPQRAYLYAAVCTVASVLGGYFGYAIGYFLYESAGRSIIGLYGLEAAYDNFQHQFAEYGFWIVAIAGFTPIPYKLITIASGAAGYDLIMFGIASLASRGARFFLEAALLKYFGPPIRAWIEKRLELVTIVAMVLLIGGFVAVRWLAH
jgi:membrane protein YqaA with SNARE-associated domain